MDPLCRQAYSFATEIACDINPANMIALEDPDGIECYLLTPAPVKENRPAHFKPSENRNTIQTNTVSARTISFYSPKRIKTFGIECRMLLTKLSDETTQALVEKTSYDFFHDSNPTSEDNKESLQSYSTRQMQKRTTDRTLTINTFSHNTGLKCY